MRHTHILMSLIATAFVLSLSGCFGEREVSPQDAPKVALELALDSLYAHKYDTYINAVYNENRKSMFPRTLAQNMLSQHVESVEAEKGRVMGCTANTVTFHSDTLATVYYTLTFADGTREQSSQKMVRHGGEWKIVVRN